MAAGGMSGLPDTLFSLRREEKSLYITKLSDAINVMNISLHVSSFQFFTFLIKKKSYKMNDDFLH